MTSLRRRAIAGGLIWATLAMLVFGVALLRVFDASAVRRFDTALAERHLYIVALLAAATDPDDLQMALSQPEYRQRASGKYWVVSGEDGAIFKSASLPARYVNQFLQNDGFWNSDGPKGQVRGVTETFTFDNGATWRVTVVSSVNDLLFEQGDLRGNFMIAFGFAGLFGILGAVLLTTAVLRPVIRMRQEIMQRWDKGEALDISNYPEEVAPLVEDINALLTRNREIVDRGRRQAADLAHAIKTPSSALRNELEALSRSNAPTAPALEALDRIDAQLGRSLARIRASNAAGVSQGLTDVPASVARLKRLFESMPLTEHATFRAEVPKTLNVPMDRQDLEETLGNLLENAFKWCEDRVALTAWASGETVKIVIEDNGPGISEERRRSALEAGTRLDTATPGTGLGLAIANDLVHAYGGELALGQSPGLSGLMVTLTLPQARKGFAPLPRVEAAE